VTAVVGLISACGTATNVSSGPATHRQAVPATAKRRQVPGQVAGLRNCITRPSACGYPDRSNTGVPAGVRLKPTGGITVTQRGAIISGVDVNGSIQINADNVTIADSRVTSSGQTGHNIVIAPGVSGTVIQDSTLRGRDRTANPVQYAVINEGTDTTVGTRLQMYNCSTCWAGPGTLRDSYAITDAVIAGAHYEPVYYGGRAGPLVLDHNTLLNPHEQTAAVFAGNDYGNQTGLVITNNLMAGGDFIIYGGAGDNPYGAATRDVTITDNRFSDVYWPHGGQYGAETSVNWSVTNWSNNYWDATGLLEPVPPGVNAG
jgi:hypothetical protein